MFRFTAFSAIAVAFILSVSWFVFARTGAQDEPVVCGQPFEGAWFSVQIPDGMTAHPVSTSNAVWVRSDDGQTEFYLYAPKWGGLPYDIFLGATKRTELERTETTNTDYTVLELHYDALIGRFEITQSKDPVSHLTIGYRTETGRLSQDFVKKFDCFKKSINQFSK